MIRQGLFIICNCVTAKVETLQEKIISLELTQPDDNIAILNGSNVKNDEDKQADVEIDDEDEPITPTTPTPGEELGVPTNKKKKRKRSKRGKH